MLTPRMIQIFKCIVEEFVQTADPVGSKTLMEKYRLPFSSATIRNEMMSLEDYGYLEKTHTSSGRIPSTQGYRFYCEHIMENLVDDHTEFALQHIFSSKNINAEEAIRESCEILSKMTNLATGVLGPDAREQVLEHVKLFPIDEQSAVCVFITNTGHTENSTFKFDREVSINDIKTCCDLLNERLKGTKISEIALKMEVLKPILAQKVKKHEMLFKAFVNAFIKFASENVYFAGQNNMLYQPEFADIEKLKSLMLMLENTNLWRDIDKGPDELALNTLTGSRLIWLDDVAVITSKFKINDEEGQFMVVGPPRMDYEKIVGMIEYISSSIEKMYRSTNDDE